MAITTLDGWIAAVKQNLTYFKSGAVTTIAAMPYTLFDMAGNPGAGALAAGNTANGIVPTDALAGYPIIAALGGSGYLSGIDFSNTIACRMSIYDRVFSCGAYAFNADTTLASIPSYSGRVPGGDYSGLQIWVEAVTASTGNLAVQVNYLDQDGNAGDTGALGIGAVFTIRRMLQLPLAAGDNGVQRLDRIRGSVASAGTFNVNVLRPLWTGRVPVANSGDVHDMLRTGLPLIYADSALFIIMYADGTSSGVPYFNIEVADG